MAPAGSEMIVDNYGKKGSRRERCQRAEMKNLIKPEWSMVGARHEEEVKEVKFDITTLSPEEQQEYHWEQTQRGLNDEVKWVDFYAIHRNGHNSKKLETPKVAQKVVPIFTEDPCPLFTEEPIPDTGLGGCLDLECLYDKCFQKAFKHDINKKIRKMNRAKTAQEDGDKFLTFAPRGTNYNVTLSDGLQSYLFHSHKYVCKRVLCVTRMTLKEVKHEWNQWFKSLKMIQVADKKVAKRFMMKEKSPLPNAFEVIFTDDDEGRRCIDQFGNCHEDFAVVVRYPDVSEADEAKEESFHSLEAHWFPIPSTHKVAIWVKHAEDVGKADKILKRHGMDGEIVDKYNPQGSRMFYSDWSSYKTEEFANDPVELETLVRTAFEANGIELDAVHLDRADVRPMSDEKIKEKIEQRLHQSLAEVRGEGMTVTGNEMWDLEVSPAVKLQKNFWEQKAQINFKNHSCDYQLLNGMMTMKPIFLCPEDKKGIHFSPVFTVKMEVPTPIRTACHGALKALDNKTRSTRNNRYYHGYGLHSWTRIRDNGTEGLLVEGWPKTRVYHVVEKVKELLKPRVVDCKFDVKNPKHIRSKLFYGCGLALLNKLQLQNADGVLISIDRLSEKLHFWGDKTKCDSILDELDRFIQNPKKHLVSNVIPIREPRFLPVFREVLAFNGETAVSEAVCGAKISFIKDSVVFEGNVEQYELLQELLDDEHSEMVKTFMASNVDYSLFIRECPMCELPPSGGVKLSNCGHIYCLECLTQKIRAAIRTKQTPIKCCSEGCNTLVPINDIVDLLFDETTKQNQKLFTERFAFLSKTATLKESDDLMFCPNDGCESVISKPKYTSNKTLSCSTCQHSVCAKCYIYHPRLSCEQYRAYKENGTVPKGMYIDASRDEVVTFHISGFY